jgi:hypothetical protein
MREGRRPNSGRKPGVKNLVGIRLKEQLLAEGASPLAFVLGVMRNPALDLNARMDAARAAMPFLHAKLQTLEHPSPAEENPRPPCVEIIFVSPKTQAAEELPVLSPLALPQAGDDVEPQAPTFVPEFGGGQ